MTASRKRAKSRHVEVERIAVRVAIDGNVAGEATSDIAAYAFIHYASEFLEAGEHLPPSAAPFSSVRCYLACRPIELALKAFLSLKGASMADMAQHYGHSLVKLLAGAEQAGLDSVIALSPEEKQQIAAASSYYNEKVFEYPSIIEALHGYPDKPDVAMLMHTARSLVDTLHPLCLEA